jgi:hypothetical protein
MVAAAPPVRGDDWKGRQRVRNLSRELRRPCISTASMPGRLPEAGRRFDPRQNLLEQHDVHVAPAMPPATSASAIGRPRRSEGRQVFAWLVVVCGTLGLFAGIALVAWSLGTEQMIYWNLALGLTLGGQGMLILGLVLNNGSMRW